ncbi:TetR/AcrR family transcriptional regulator [Gordonia rhizosphera]|nr:TetR/AcrR family transcriptional regulator [Gordonia rhizosphera]
MMSLTAQMIAQRGYHLTNLDDIAEQMDLSKASIYHYFDGKEALVMATLESCATYVEQRLTETAAREGTSAERLENLIRTQIELISVENVDIARLFLQSFDWPPSIGDAVHEWQRRHGRIFREVIHAGIESGEFVVRDERIACMAIQGAMNLVPVWYGNELARGDTKVLDDITASLMRIVIAAG